MGFWFLVFFVAPIVEMYLLIRVGGYIGALPTILLVVLAAVAGVALLRAQGLAALTRGMSRLESGELPARQMAEGVLLAVAGALLIVPGFVTDLLALLLLVPPVRGLLARRMVAGLVVASPHGPRPRAPGGEVIEGEFESRLDDDERPRGGNPGRLP